MEYLIFINLVENQKCMNCQVKEKIQGDLVTEMATKEEGTMRTISELNETIEKVNLN